MSKWINWSEKRPEVSTDGSNPKNLFWWRVGHSEICGCAPEWIEPLVSVGMGYAENEMWPGFSDWNGYRRSLPESTQWRELTKEERSTLADVIKSSIRLSIDDATAVFPGVDLVSCPFCRRKPEIKFTGRYIGARVYHSESFRITCKCGVAGTPRMVNLPSAVERWNSRA